jgi:hypothetical protein
MLYTYSKKVLLYLPDGSLRTQISEVISSHFLSPEQSPTRISTFEALRKETPLAKGLSFFHQDFFALSQEFGVPYFIVINLSTDLSLPKETDPDRLLLLKTIILTFVKLSLNQQYAEARAHLLIVVDRADAARAEEFERDYTLLFKGLETGNDQFDARIDLLKKDKAAFSRLFLVRFQKSEELFKSTEMMIKGFISQIETRATLEKKLKSLSVPVISTKNDAPALVLFNDGSSLFIDGKPSVPAEEYAALETGRFHILGSLTTRNLKDVTERIKTSVQTGIGRKKFNVDDDIIITMQKDCQIDATAATGLAQLFVSGLARYKKKRIIVSTVNDGILRKSQGYGLIKEFVRVDSY